MKVSVLVPFSGTCITYVDVPDDIEDSKKVLDYIIKEDLLTGSDKYDIEIDEIHTKKIKPDYVTLW